jgi:hypothetical protein
MSGNGLFFAADQYLKLGLDVELSIGWRPGCIMKPPCSCSRSAG